MKIMGTKVKSRKKMRKRNRQSGGGGERRGQRAMIMLCRAVVGNRKYETGDTVCRLAMMDQDVKCFCAMIFGWTGLGNGAFHAAAPFLLKSQASSVNVPSYNIQASEPCTLALTSYIETKK
jgi:hypothetical protein